MTVDIAKLRELMAAAKPGTWHRVDYLAFLSNAAPELLDELDRLRRLEAAGLEWDLAQRISPEDCTEVEFDRWSEAHAAWLRAIVEAGEARAARAKEGG